MALDPDGNVVVPVPEGTLLRGMLLDMLDRELTRGAQACATNNELRRVLAQAGHPEALVVGDLLLPDLLRGVRA